MKISVNWLKTLVDTGLSNDELAHTLTMAGLEVEEMSPVGALVSKVVVGEVKTVSPHPNADKLRVTEVDIGSGPLLQIVCGAPNVVVGMRVPCAQVGASLPGFEIKEATLRGVASSGMLCSAKELGLSDDHGGLLSLPSDTKLGQDIRETLDLDDIVFTLKLTPNRGDCLSMLGVARDLAAVTGAKLAPPANTTVAATCEDSRAVTISAPEACGRYLGRVIRNLNVKAATPDWMKRRLERAGLRPIAPLVDITNYVMLERGQPMHAFDLDKLDGAIDVRFARAGETMKLLNEQDVTLQPDMLLITDTKGAVAMGGVMGGYESMVTNTTQSVFFEAAYFDPDVIQGKTRLLGINSDAAFRFERGVDPQLPRDALEAATKLALEICGTATTKVGPITEATGAMPARACVDVHADRAVHLIGTNIPTREISAMLKRLQCELKESFGVLITTPPSYRFDLNIEEDFVEEIARLYGYARIPVAAPKAAVAMLPMAEGRRSNARLRRELAALGYQEVINYSFVPPAWETGLAGNTAPVTLANPIASHLSVMRTSLLGGLISTLQGNLNRGEARLQIFELGRCFLSAEASLAAQPERIAGLIYGGRAPEQWGLDHATRTDFFDIKGDVESLLEGFSFTMEPLSDHPALHPGRAARVLIEGKVAGYVGELHPKWQQHFELPMSPVVFELDVACLNQAAKTRFIGISKMQAVRRDIAILVDQALPVQACLDAVKGRNLPGLVAFSLFDLYQGQNLESGKKSLAFRIVMQDTERTLTEVDIAKVYDEVVKVLDEKCSATIRK